MGLRADTEKRIDDWSQYSFPALARHVATGVDGGEDLQHPTTDELLASLGQIVRALRATVLDLADEIERLQEADEEPGSEDIPHQ